MEAYPDVSPLWDLSQASSFSQLPDDDFLALLQKQFPSDSSGNAYSTGGFVNGVNPQNISRYPLPSITPPSEDSSPSPSNDSGGMDDMADFALKRKASMEDFEDGPNQKSQHTLVNRKASSSNTPNAASSSKRKLTGAPPKDETRLLKRKEQNRAAQRAFRERKEKHVKDLEDKVAALEAKNEQAVSENENLRDLLSRLQNENVMLKQSSFTFAVPKTAGSSPDSARASGSFTSGSRATTVASSPPSSRASPKITNPLDWSSLTTFDPAMLNLLDESPQPTATDGAMQMDFGFGGTPYTTIASNPMFMSYASTFDTASPPVNPPDNNSFNFDVNSISPWPSSANPQEASFDELFGGYLGSTGPVDYPSFLSNSPASIASISPVAHHINVSHAQSTNDNHAASRSPATSSSSPSSIRSDPSSFATPGESSASETEVCHNEAECPKTKEDLLRRIESQGASPFAPPVKTVRKASDGLGSIIMCNGSTSFPKTNESAENVEVLSAWRSITSNPKFKDADINELCTEFTDKARCDGTKVVLEPQGVHSIMQALAKQ